MLDLRAQLTGYPRIGPERELKWTLERAWAGRLDDEQLATRITELRAAHLAEQRGIIGSAADDFFLYDEVLETALMFGLVPSDYSDRLASHPFQVLSSLARGTVEREAWEMTKWFDTNYHYVVPEIEGLAARFTPLPWREPTGDDDVTWVVLGPYSLVKLSRRADDVEATDLARSVGAALSAWLKEHAASAPAFRLQLDEPSLGLTMSAADEAIRDAAYETLADIELSAPPLVTVQFGTASERTIAALGRAGFVVQVALDVAAELSRTPAWAAQPEHLIAVIDGRTPWPDDFERTRSVLESLPDDGRLTRLVPSTSLMFLPYTVEGEELPHGFQFAREKAAALARWPRAVTAGEVPNIVKPPAAEWPPVGDVHQRAARPERRAAQADLNLPLYPTTTTGSLPQTNEVRQLRAELARGDLDLATYRTRIEALITDAIRWQERIGLDVLVHGEFERTDMVEYFAERMDGFYTTRHGWVVSYGSRCTRPPILAAPPGISGPMTVEEWKIAQAATDKPVKGMLTGPVTVVNWSFRPPDVSDDRLFWAVAQPIAEEVGHLVEAGAKIVQIDEPAVRERWPLPTAAAEQLRRIYARGVRAALSHVFNQPPHVQMHTHMCYGDFGDIVPLWSDAGVDVASIEFSRSKDDSYIRAFYELYPDGHLQIGPGVFDVHSPHTPGREVMTERVSDFGSFMDASDLWVNPDCGLKTRRWEEIERQLSDMVAAARQQRGSVVEASR